MINLHDKGDIVARCPIMTAHRGGVIAADAPEKQQGYDLVELDICCAADQAPVLFYGHGGRGGLLVDCNIAGTIGDFASTELVTFPYRGTDQTIPTLEMALELCAQHNLGIMLDMKKVTHPLLYFCTFAVKV